MILDPNLCFSLREVKNDEFMDTLGHLLISTQTGTENEFLRRFLLFFTTDHRYAFIYEEAGQPETKRSKMSVSRKILGKEYYSASNLRTHRDKCFVGWYCTFLTLRQNGRQVFPPTFRDKQETLGALAFIFCRLSANWCLSKTLHTPGPVNSIMSICR